MDPTGTLVGLAEISLALAGFAAIVLILGTRGTRMEPETAAIVRVMVLNAVGSAFACLIGVAILALQVSPPFAWVLASAIVLTGTVAGSAANQLLFLRKIEERNLGRVVLWWSFAGAGVAVHLANVLGLVGPPSFGLFFLGLVIILGQAAAQFVYMVFALIDRSAA